MNGYQHTIQNENHNESLEELVTVSDRKDTLEEDNNTNSLINVNSLMRYRNMNSKSSEY